MKWFKHMSDSSDDSFIEDLEEIFGLEGYARWWKLLEVIAKKMDKTNDCSASHTWVKWQSLLKGKKNKLILFLEHCQNEHKIKLEQNGNILKITCPKLLKLRDEHTRKSGVAREEVAPDLDPDLDTDKDIEEDPTLSEGQQAEAKSDGSFFKNNNLNRSGSGWNVLEHLSLPAYEKAVESIKFTNRNFDEMVKKYNDEFIAGTHKGQPPKDPDSAFNAWILKYTKGEWKT